MITAESSKSFSATNNINMNTTDDHSSDRSSATTEMHPSNSSEKTGCRKSIGKYFCFCKGVLFASGLVFSDKWIEYTVLALLITYFIRGDSEEGVYPAATAAMLATIQEGVSASLEIVMTFISKAFLGRFLVITVSSLFYVTGLVVLFYISPIGSIPLLALGHAGVQPLIREFIVEEFRNHKPEYKQDIKQAIVRKNMWCRVVWCFSAVAAFLTYYFSDSLNFLAWVTGSSLVLFLCGSTRFYHSEKLANTCSRFKGLRDKMTRCIRPAAGSTQSPEEQKTDRRAGTESTESPEEQKTERKKKLKNFQKKVCMWTTFLLFGLVLSAGKTIFPSLGANMELSELLPSLVIIQSISRKMISFLFELLLSKWVPEAYKNKVKLVRIWLGMLLSIPCFIVAWQIEDRRLELFSKNKEALTPVAAPSYTEVPTIKIFWLAPQFCLLGFMEGLAQDGLDEFMICLFPDQSRKEYASAINALVIGLGTFSHILSVYVNRSLFGKNVNESRLDKYFKRLAIVASVNLCYYTCISLVFYSDTPGKSDSEEKDEQSRKDFTDHESQWSKFLSALLEPLQ